MALNDISVRPSLQQMSIQGSHILYYGAEGPDTPTVIWPGEYVDIQLPPQIQPNFILALEPCPDCARSTRNWPHPNIVEAVAGHVCILNDTTEPQHLAHHEHFCQVLPTLTSVVFIVDNTLPPVPLPSTAAEPIPLHSSTVQLGPDHILSTVTTLYSTPPFPDTTWAQSNLPNERVVSPSILATS